MLSTSAPMSSIHVARRFTSHRKACASRWTLAVSLPASVTTCRKKAPTKHTYGSRERAHREQGSALGLCFRGRPWFAIAHTLCRVASSCSSRARRRPSAPPGVVGNNGMLAHKSG